MLAQAFAAQSCRNPNSSPRDAIRELIAAAKQGDCFANSDKVAKLGELVSKRTGESSVYFNAGESAYYKVKHPLAKSAIKRTTPADWLFEHVIHNILFPTTAYEFIAIAEEGGEACIILKQPEISSESFPSEEQIATSLTSIGLRQEDRYFFGNAALSVTDVGAHSDNVLLGENNQPYFIDPLIRLKLPAIEAIDWLVGNLE